MAQSKSILVLTEVLLQDLEKLCINKCPPRLQFTEKYLKDEVRQQTITSSYCWFYKLLSYGI